MPNSLLWLAVSACGLWFSVHWCYAAMMAAKSAKEGGRLTLYWQVILLPLAAVGLLLDFAFQFTFGWMLFLESPFGRGWLFSSRVHYHYRESTGWRADLAEFWARNLNVFDPTHIRP